MIVALLFAAFLFGSIPTGYVIAMIKGVDLRKVGSGNIGATNVLRAMGKGAAIITLAGDVLKGVIPVSSFQDSWYRFLCRSPIHALHSKVSSDWPPSWGTISRYSSSSRGAKGSQRALA